MPRKQAGDGNKRNSTGGNNDLAEEGSNVSYLDNFLQSESAHSHPYYIALTALASPTGFPAPSGSLDAPSTLPLPHPPLQASPRTQTCRGTSSGT